MEEFSETSDLRSVALVVEGQKLWVCPQQLALQSEVFYQMFFKTGTRIGPSCRGMGDQKNGPTLFPVGETTLEFFVPFLRSLTGSRSLGEDEEQSRCPKIMTESNCLRMLELAERFQVWYLKRVGERFLETELKSSQSEYSDVDILELLVFCKMFNLKDSVKSAAVEKIRVRIADGHKFEIELIRQYKDRLEKETIIMILRRKLLKKDDRFLLPMIGNEESFKMLNFLEEIEVSEQSFNGWYILIQKAAQVCKIGPSRLEGGAPHGNGFMLFLGQSEKGITITNPNTISKILQEANLEVSAIILLEGKLVSSVLLDLLSAKLSRMEVTAHSLEKEKKSVEERMQLLVQQTRNLEQSLERQTRNLKQSLERQIRNLEMQKEAVESQTERLEEKKQSLRSLERKLNDSLKGAKHKEISDNADKVEAERCGLENEVQVQDDHDVPKEE